jgi:hypothetical protein
MGLMAWIEVWLIANALLVVWRSLVTTDEIAVRVGSIDYSAWVGVALMREQVESTN